MHPSPSSQDSTSDEVTPNSDTPSSKPRKGGGSAGWKPPAWPSLRVVFVVALACLAASLPHPSPLYSTLALCLMAAGAWLGFTKSLSRRVEAKAFMAAAFIVWGLLVYTASVYEHERKAQVMAASQALQKLTATLSPSHVSATDPAVPEQVDPPSAALAATSALPAPEMAGPPFPAATTISDSPPAVLPAPSEAPNPKDLTEQMAKLRDGLERATELLANAPSSANSLKWFTVKESVEDELLAYTSHLALPESPLAKAIASARDEIQHLEPVEKQVTAARPPAPSLLTLVLGYAPALAFWMSIGAGLVGARAVGQTRNASLYTKDSGAAGKEKGRRNQAQNSSATSREIDEMREFVSHTKAEMVKLAQQPAASYPEALIAQRTTELESLLFSKLTLLTYSIWASQFLSLVAVLSSIRAALRHITTQQDFPEVMARLGIAIDVVVLILAPMALVFLGRSLLLRRFEKYSKNFQRLTQATYAEALKEATDKALRLADESKRKLVEKKGGTFQPHPGNNGNHHLNGASLTSRTSPSL